MAFAQQYQCDVFGFGESLRKSDLRKWKEVQGKWAVLFSKAEIQVKVDLKIEGTGMRVKKYPF
ncbi:Ger(x)C family spore germination C-terminal domain-containing protein [Peribacillus sp. B-H-3]|uniref:Ger(x)C family spore germination C-terminal domain-containing protein n=1 Tax=Peribacillus sp. B-H-3 TaxID=3400420 RepID=UPI003B012A01